MQRTLRPSSKSHRVYIEHLRIPVGSGALHIERVGRGGPPVVLLHGFGTCAFLWRSVAPRLANAGFTVLAVDLMGYGESDRPIDAGYGIVAQAEHLDRALTAMRLPKALIVGQDIGAIVALQLAARRPERVGRLLLINPPNPADLPGPSIRAAQRSAARIALGVQGLFVTGQALTPFFREAVANPDHMPDLLVARYMAPFIGSVGLSHLLLLARSLEMDEEDAIQLQNIHAPVLIVLGEKDTNTDRAGVNELASELSGSPAVPRVEIVPDAGFLVAEDNSPELARIIGDWVNVSAAPDVDPVFPTGEICPE
jgi:pimeloyl-ACP methyl ester carboxylesterase